MNTHDFENLPPAGKVGRLICAARKEQGLSQAALAARIGVEQATVSKWEHGKVPTSTHLAALLLTLQKLKPEPVLRHLGQHHRDSFEPEAAA